ncbi:MAG: SDR family oxidoreductase [Candidatus Aminicenantes bacterium]|nr:SDR family oxidoreductase [Candidatus Aminicenantes bacterium]
MNILLTGATGYVGGRLKERLLGRSDVRLRLLVRNARKLRGALPSSAGVFEGDTFSPASLAPALEGVEIAYYLVHSMGGGGHFEKRDLESAVNFRDACIDAGVRRVIYLGGLGRKEDASPHLRSRIETGETLAARPDRLELVWLRAGVIIGAGSSSFEVMRHLIEKLPVMIAPRWVRTLTQPIGVEDVLDYLVLAKDVSLADATVVADIGSEAMSFREMILRAARAMGLRRILVPVPLLTPRLSSYWLALITPVPYAVASALIEGLKSETVVQNDNAAKFFPQVRPAPFEETVRRAMESIARGQIISRWCDSSGGESCDVDGREESLEGAVYRDVRRRSFRGLPADAVFRAVKSVGGKQGWFRFDWLWRIRGILDKLAGGYGTNRGRRDERELAVGDKLDFWKVADLREGRRLLLEAQMRLPGRAWLELRLEGETLVQTAFFLPRGWLGRLYWYAIWPLHSLVFSDLIRGVVRLAQSRFEDAGGLSAES